MSPREGVLWCWLQPELLQPALCVREYPGKHRLIHRIVCQRHIQQALNSLRRRANKPPLRF